MSFAEPSQLYFLLLLPLALLVLVLSLRRHRQRLRAFSVYAEKLGLVGRYLFRRSLIKLCLVLAALGLIVVSWAGPRWGFEWREIKQRGLDIMVVVDVSESMLASDVKPNRIEKAKREVYDLIGQLKGDRIGIIAFAGVSFVQCPLTIDYSAARSFLSYLRTDLIPVQGSALGEALELAHKSMTSSGEANKGERIVVLISDGEDHSEDALKAAEALKKAGIKIYAVGLGDPDGAPIPDIRQGGFKKDRRGKVVLSKLNESLLKSLAQKTGGDYRRSSGQGFQLGRNFYSDLGLATKKGEKEVRRQKKWHERYQWFVGLALLLLLIEMMLSEYGVIKK